MPQKPLRLWPGVIFVTLQWLFWFGVPAVAPGIGASGMLGGMVFTLAFITWWLFFSRAPWLERIGVIALMIVAVIAVRPLMDLSVTNGMMGMMHSIFSIPSLCLALVLALAFTRHANTTTRRIVTAIAVFLGAASLGLIRTDGVTGEGLSQLAFRWTPTAEQRLMAQRADDPPVAPALTSNPIAPASSPLTTPVTPAPAPRAEWPGFRGPARDGVIRGVTIEIETDWATKPPVELWRKPIGPAWSSFAVQGNFIYTQEQRGEHEAVSSYDLATGAPVWRHTDPIRFYESNGGAGPRATPALAHGRVYSMGATGVLNALDAGTGAVVWSRNAVSDTGVKLPDWGIAGSPLVVDDAVIVAASGRLAAYDAATGKPRWTGPARGSGYGSPHLVTMAGVPQVLLQSGAGITSVAPATGTVLWLHDWDGAAILQPIQMPDGDLLVTTGDMMGGVGTRRLKVARTGGAWTVEERWTSRALKPYFSDSVVHNGYAYGFDGNILACIDLADGARKWKGGRYGAGQLVLLADQDLLLVLSEEGELVLVKATPDQFTEVARHPAIEGKTWNHLVVVGDRLLVRNGEEMVAFRLPATVRR